MADDNTDLRQQQQHQLEWSNGVFTRKQTATVYFTTSHGTAEI